MPTHTFTFGVTNGGVSLNKRVDVTAGAEHNLDESIPGSSTNLAVAFAVAIAKLKSFYLVSDKALVVKTNSSGSPANTFTLAAGIPFLWTVNSPAFYDTTPAVVTTNITSLYVTNADADPAQLQLLAIVDPT